VKRWTVALSLLVHAGAALGFVAFSFWKIEKLHAKEDLTQVALGTTAPPPGDPAPAPAAPAEAKLKVETPKRPDEVVQPTDQKVAPDSGSGTAPADPNARTAPGGTGDGCDGCDPDGTGEDPFAPPGHPPGIGTSLDRPDTVPEPPAKPALVPIGELRRVSGDPQIQLPPAALGQVRDAGKTRLEVTALLCVDETGAPESVSFRQPSGFPAVDDAIRAGMRTWRYAPFTVDGRPARACAIVRFTYQLTE
jgi:protein TonB